MAVGAWLTAAPAAAQRDVVGDEGVDWRTELRAHAGAGYDTNPRLAATPEQRRAVGGMPGEEPDPSGFAQGRARLRLWLGSRWWTRIALRLDGRQYFDGDRLGEERLEVEGGWRSRHWLVGLSVRGSRYDRRRTADDSWAGRARLRARVRLAPAQLSAHAFGATRAYDAMGQVDWRGGGGLAVGVTPNGWLFAAGIDAERRRSNDALATRNEIAPWLVTGLELGIVEAEAFYVAYLRDFDEAPRDGHEHVIGARAVVSPWPEVGLLVRAEYGRARAGERQALVYDRVEVLGGIRLRLEHGKRAPLPSESAPRRQGGATLTEDGVRFAYRFPDAERVAVIGSFNDWDPERGRLARTEGGWFEGTLDVPPGRHRYQLLVDGEPTVPDDAEGYVDDDFGGRNAVLQVPER